VLFGGRLNIGGLVRVQLLLMVVLVVVVPVEENP